MKCAVIGATVGATIFLLLGPIVLAIFVAALGRAVKLWK